MSNEKHVRNSFYNGSRIDDIEANENRGPAGSQGLPGFSPRARVTQTENGARIIITDKNGTTYADITNGRNGVDGNNGSNGFSPIAEVEEVEDGAQLTVTDNRGTTTALIRNGERGERGEQGIQGPSGPQGKPGQQGIQGPAGPQGQPGQQGIQGPAGADGFSPTVEVTETTNGHTVTITDKDGLHSFEVTNGTDGQNGQNGENGQNGSDGAAATIQIGNVETLAAGSNAYVRNTGNENSAVFDFGIPQGIQGSAGPSNVTPIITEGTAIADINGTTIFAPTGGSEFNGNHVYSILSTGSTGSQFQGTINADSLEPGDIIFVYYYGTNDTEATLEVTLNNSVITAPIMYRDIINNTSNSTSEVIPELKNVTYQIGKSDAIGGTTQGGLGVIKLQYWPAETYVYSNRRGTLVYNSVDMFLLMELDGMYLLQPARGDEVKFSFSNIFNSPNGTANISYVESGIKVGIKNQIPYITGYLGFRIVIQITIP
jgi:hypothetical protein